MFVCECLIVDTESAYLFAYYRGWWWLNRVTTKQKSRKSATRATLRGACQERQACRSSDAAARCLSGGQGSSNPFLSAWLCCCRWVVRSLPSHPSACSDQLHMRVLRWRWGCSFLASSWSWACRGHCHDGRRWLWHGHLQKIMYSKLRT